MARKHLLTGFSHSHVDAVQSNGSRTEYTRRGASAAMKQSLDELAENSLRLLEGETIVNLDPLIIDGSFVGDRVGNDEEEFVALRDAISASGQSTPILVRPHPEHPGRYMIVFGHRRARAARELGIPVRAIVKDIEDIAHVIAQGQENTARADLTFIERARFAGTLLKNGMSKEVIKASLSVDDTLLSRMLAVIDTVPDEVIKFLGAAKGVGRDRWEDLKKLLSSPQNLERAVLTTRRDDLKTTDEPQRFNILLTDLKMFVNRPKAVKKPITKKFAVAANSVAVTTQSGGKTFTLSMSAKDAPAFGEFVTIQLEELYKDFRSQQTSEGE
ncbi:plasmid partitioning protein RepB [Rhizobium panacihumi]|uniref:plasmid partitioning protein RepB n=1 Tax=Rhizobium panacihumi TaxID=2008450 RepID=UPI003D7A3226